MKDTNFASTLPAVLDHVRLATLIDGALERTLRPDGPERRAETRLTEIDTAIAWARNDLTAAREIGGGIDEQELATLASELGLSGASPAELRRALRWRAQASLIEAAAQAV